MSYIDLGRGRTESCEVDLVAVGQQIIDEHGIRYTVVSIDLPLHPDTTTLVVERSQHSRGRETFTRPHSAMVKVARY